MRRFPLHYGDFDESRVLAFVFVEAAACMRYRVSGIRYQVRDEMRFLVMCSATSWRGLGWMC